jgi:hypothetical protein
MNTHPILRHGLKSLSFRRLIPAVLLGAGFAASSYGEGEHRMYTFFEGADIYVGQAGQLLPVRDVSGGAWVVRDKGHDETVSPSKGALSMKITPTPKLSDESVTFGDMKVAGAYTLQNDPEVKLTRSLAEAAELNAGDTAAANQSNAITITNLAGGTPNTNNGVTTTSSSSTPESVSTNTNDTLAFQNWNSGSGYDLLDVSFKLSSSKPLNDPYVVVVTKFHEPGASEGSFKNLIYAKALEPIGPKPTDAKFQQSGFPPGYQLLGLEIHLYNAGQEIATNLSERRREMAFPEAFDYIRDSYLRDHKNDTRPATPVMVDILPADFREKIAQGLYANVVYVKVSRGGVGEDAYSDSECSKRIDDPYLESVVKCIRFEPALENGKAVEGRSALALSRLRA